MERTSVWLTDDQRRRLASLSKSTGLKAAELIRRFIDEGLEREERKQDRKGKQ